MFLTVHSTVGVIIGQNTGNVWLAFLLGLFSHFLLDLIPHGDDKLFIGKTEITQKAGVKKMAWMGLIDLITMTIMLGALYGFGLITFSASILAAIFGAIIPDFITGFYLLTKASWLEKYLDFHRDLHFISKKFDISALAGLSAQGVFLIFFLFIIIFY